MPKNEFPRIMYYATATKAVNHGAPCIENGVVGVAVKQKAPSATTALSTWKTVGIGEKFAIISKGVVLVPTVAGFAKGDLVYIKGTDNSISETDDATTQPFGRIVEVGGERGCPTGYVRVDLDHKDVFPNV